MGFVSRTERNRVIPRESFDEMTDERGNLLDAATIAANANAAFPAGRDDMMSLFDPKTIPRREARAAAQAAEEEPFYNGMQSMFDDEAAQLEVSLPHAPVEGNEDGIFSGLAQRDFQYNSLEFVAPGLFHRIPSPARHLILFLM